MKGNKAKGIKHLQRGTKEFDFKFACDSYDLMQRGVGKELLSGAMGEDYAKKHCKVNSIPYERSFINKCVSARKKASVLPRELTEDLCRKYHVGYFKTSPENCFDSDYILFNKEQLSFWKSVDVNLWGLEFMVIPSFDREWRVNDIAFRILNPEKVNYAFKWLFAFGQQATFGLQLTDPSKPLLLCEGFQDMVALRESKYLQAVGLGSVEITNRHKKQLNTENYVFCQDMDEHGMRIRKGDMARTCFYSPPGKDPYEVFLKHGKVDIIEIGSSLKKV